MYLLGIVASWTVVAIHNDRNESIYHWHYGLIFLSFGFIILLSLSFLIIPINNIITNPSLKHFKKHDKTRER